MSGAWYKNSKTIDCNSCQQLCASEAVCKGYEFDKTPNVNKNCHLYKNPAYRSGTYNTHTSGMKKIPCSTNSNFEVKNNKAMSGAWYKNFKTRDCNSCQQLCASETVCKGYEFDKTPNVNKNCHLYQNPTYRSGTYNTHTSGKKKFPCSDTDVFEVKNNKAMSGAWYKILKLLTVIVVNNYVQAKQFAMVMNLIRLQMLIKIVIYTKIQFIEVEHIILILVV